jgi:hypothetical protein
MFGWLETVRKENRHLSAFFPAVVFGYIYTKGYTSVCTLDIGLDIWSYTGLPSIVYLSLAAIGLVTGALNFELADADEVPDKTKNSRVVNWFVDIHGLLALLTVVPLLLRVCKGDVVLNTLLLITSTMWLTMFFKRLFIDRIQDEV